MNQEIVITKIQFDANKIIQKGEQQMFDVANQKHKDGNTYRNSKVTWIKKWPELTQHIDRSISHFQNTWGFDLKTFEPLQYSQYNIGDHYDWHIDSHKKPYDNGLIRKLSFTLCLNEDYEGGDFRISQPHPNSDKVVVESFKPKTGTMIVFPSHIWHKVGEVTKGTRKSLVGWVVGKQWQ